MLCKRTNIKCRRLYVSMLLSYHVTAYITIIMFIRIAYHLNINQVSEIVPQHLHLFSWLASVDNSKSLSHKPIVLWGKWKAFCCQLGLFPLSVMRVMKLNYSLHCYLLAFSNIAIKIWKLFTSNFPNFLSHQNSVRCLIQSRIVNTEFSHVSS